MPVAAARAPKKARVPGLRCIDACVMDAITLVAFIGSIHPVGQIAERRGRRFEIRAWIAP